MTRIFHMGPWHKPDNKPHHIGPVGWRQRTFGRRVYYDIKTGDTESISWWRHYWRKFRT